jgi:hypothetical protein
MTATTSATHSPSSAALRRHDAGVRMRKVIFSGG